MTLFSPAFALGLVIASAYGLVFFLAFGKGWTRLLVYWSAGVIGFALGQWFSNAAAFSLLSIGSVSILEGTLMSWIALFAVRAIRVGA